MTECNQLIAQGLIIEDFTVVGDNEVAAFHRLRAERGQLDYG